MEGLQILMGMRMGKKLACVMTSLLLYATPAVAEASGNDWRQYDEYTKRHIWLVLLILGPGSQGMQ
jgi:hypothetical protein